MGDWLVGPGFDGRGAVSQLVSTIDLAPTLLDAAGLPVPREMMGRPITRLLQHRDATTWPEDVLIQVSEAHTGRAIRTARWKYAVRRPVEHEFAEEGPSSEVYEDEFLYDLEVDPWELTNLIGMPPYAEVVTEMRTRLARRMSEAGEVTPQFIDAPEQPCEQRQLFYPGA